jgi:hypothetical protein
VTDASAATYKFEMLRGMPRDRGGGPGSRATNGLVGQRPSRVGNFKRRRVGRLGRIHFSPLGEMILVPHGVEHRPHADEEVSILLFEPAATLNTGNVVTEHAVTQVERI